MSVISNKILLKIRQVYMSISRRYLSRFLTADRPEKSCKNHRRCQFTERCPDEYGHDSDPGIYHRHRCCRDHDGKRLASGTGILKHDPIMIAGIFLVQKISHKRWQIYRKKSSNLNAYVHEDIAGMNVVQSLVRRTRQRNFENLTDEHRNALWMQSFCRYVRTGH